MTNYSDEQMRGNHSHVPDTRTEQEKALGRMTDDQRRDYLDRIDHTAEMSRRADKQAQLRAKVAAGVEASLAGNQQLIAQRMGVTKVGSYTLDGQTTIKSLHAGVGSDAITAPQALVDRLAVTVGGINLGPEQAKAMLANGEITAKDYAAGLAAALAPYGMKAPGSFR